MADSKQAPLDAEAAAKAAFTSVQDKPFPDDIFTAPELRWAVIGCGVIANQMAQSLALAGRKLAGVANRTLSKAQAFAEQYGIEKVYETVEDLYADPNIDAVYITTPHNTHITYLRAALAAGGADERSAARGTGEVAGGVVVHQRGPGLRIDAFAQALLGVVDEVAGERLSAAAPDAAAGEADRLAVGVADESHCAPIRSVAHPSLPLATGGQRTEMA